MHIKYFKLPFFFFLINFQQKCVFPSLNNWTTRWGVGWGIWVWKLREEQRFDIHSGGAAAREKGNHIWKLHLEVPDQTRESNPNPFHFSRCHTPCLQIRRKFKKITPSGDSIGITKHPNFSSLFQRQPQVTWHLLAERFPNPRAKTSLSKSITNFSNRNNSYSAESKFRFNLIILQYKQKALASKIRKESSLWMTL